MVKHPSLLDCSNDYNEKVKLLERSIKMLNLVLQQKMNYKWALLMMIKCTSLLCGRNNYNEKGKPAQVQYQKYSTQSCFYQLKCLWWLNALAY